MIKLLAAVFRYLRKRIPFSEAAYMLLIYLCMFAVLLGVELVVRGTSVEVLHLLLVLGIVTGWLLGRSSLKPWLVVLIGLITGFFFTILHVNGIDAALGDLFRSSLGYLWTLAIERVSDPAPLVIQLSEIQTRILEVGFDLSIWINDLLSGFVVYNQISTLYSWGLLIWTLSGWFSWVTVRLGKPLWGLLPTGTMLSIFMTYTLQKRASLVLLLGSGLILLGMVNHDLKRAVWKEKGVKGVNHVRESLYLTVLGVSLATMLLAGIMPSIRIKPIADRFQRLVYGSEEGEEGDGTGGSVDVGGFNSDLYSVQRFAGLPRQKLIGSGPELAKRVVMIVNYPTLAFAGSELPSAARYWRSYSYDQYTGSGWQSSPTVEVSYQPGQEISSITSDAFDVVTQEFRLSNAVRGILFSAGEPVTIDHEILISWRTLVEEGSNGDSQIVGMADIFTGTLDTILYQVRSLVSTASDEELRNTTTEIPDWIRERYLTLPDSVPARVVLLAREIIANQPTKYDQAKAIEAYLRTYPYTLDLPAPPSDRDVADYFLFELQTGYCDYYATSMVVLARAVGLPARAVVGYVGGQYDQENDYYLVTEADAHTWVEIYFSGYGWIPFEPTAAQSLIDDQEPILPLPPELATLPQVVEVEEGNDFPWWQVGVGVFILACLGAWVQNRIDLIQLRRMDSSKLILKIYTRLYRYGRWMGIGHLRSDTLYEFKERIAEVFQSLEEKNPESKRYEDVYSDLDQLTDLAVKANYSPSKLEDNLNEEIIQVWKTLRLRLLSAVWIKFWLAQWQRVNFWDRDDDGLELIGDGAADGTR